MTEILIANNACITRYRNLVSLLDDVSHANVLEHQAETEIRQQQQQQQQAVRRVISLHWESLLELSKKRGW